MRTFVPGRAPASARAYMLEGVLFVLPIGAGHAQTSLSSATSLASREWGSDLAHTMHRSGSQMVPLYSGSHCSSTQGENTHMRRQDSHGAAQWRPPHAFARTIDAHTEEA